LWFVGGFVSGITIGLLMLFLIMWAFSKCFDEVMKSLLEVIFRFDLD